PSQRFGMVERHAASMIVQAAEIGLSRRMTLFGRLAIPFQRLGIVLRQAKPTFVHHAEIVFGVELPLFGRLAEPLCSLGCVPRHALTSEVHDPEIVLRVAIAPVGQRAQQLHRFRIVATLGGSIGVVQWGSTDGSGKTRDRSGPQQDSSQRAPDRHLHGHARWSPTVVPRFNGSAGANACPAAMLISVWKVRTDTSRLADEPSM